jgi:hypothetical protein
LEPPECCFESHSDILGRNGLVSQGHVSNRDRGRVEKSLPKMRRFYDCPSGDVGTFFRYAISCGADSEGYGAGCRCGVQFFSATPGLKKSAKWRGDHPSSRIADIPGVDQRRNPDGHAPYGCWPFRTIPQYRPRKMIRRDGETCVCLSTGRVRRNGFALGRDPAWRSNSRGRGRHPNFRRLGHHRSAWQPVRPRLAATLSGTANAKCCWIWVRSVSSRPNGRPNWQMISTHLRHQSPETRPASSARPRFLLGFEQWSWRTDEAKSAM